MNNMFKKFHDLRIDNDLSQEDMAKILKMNRRVYSHCESGRNLFPLKVIVEFANYFKINIDYLFGLDDKHQIETNYTYNNDITTKRLFQIRKELNLSQKQFGELLNLNQRTYASYENNERTINIIILLNIAKAFNYSLDYLIGRDNKKRLIMNHKFPLIIINLFYITYYLKILLLRYIHPYLYQS